MITGCEINDGGGDDDDDDDDDDDKQCSWGNSLNVYVYMLTKS